MSEAAREVLQEHAGAGHDQLIPILQHVQQRQGYLSADAIVAIGRHLGLSAARIYGVATFYNQFRFEPRGRHHIQVCRGTACHVKGSAAVLEELERALGVRAGATTRDGEFSLEVVACIGACGLAPVISVDGNFHAGVAPEDVGRIIDDYRDRD